MNYDGEDGESRGRDREERGELERGEGEGQFKAVTHGFLIG